MSEQVHTDAGRSAGERASEARDQLRERAQETDHAVREFVMEHPFAAVGGALATAPTTRTRRPTRSDHSQTEQGASTEGVQREFRRAREDTEAVVEDLRKLSAELGSLLRERLESHPYLTLGASAAIGYVLGGGLPKGSPTLAIGLTTRMAASWLLGELGGSAVAQAAGATEEEK